MQQVRPKESRSITSGHRPGGAAPVRETCIANQATSHTVPHSFAKMIYTHMLNRGGKGVRSPVDTL